MTTTDCAEVEGLLVEWLDGKLPAETELRLRAHAEGCASCGQSLARWQRALPAVRELAPNPPTPLALRRMELAIERELQATPVTGAAGRGLPRFRWAALAAAAACALLLVGHRLLRGHSTAPAYGRLDTATGQVLLGGSPAAAGAELSSGSTLALTTPGESAFDLGRDIRARLGGPGRLTLLGDSAVVRVHLESGELGLALGPRRPGEAFTVETRDGRVEVRGTRFSVGFAGQGSWVRVDEGRVAAFRVGDAAAYPVAAGQTFWLAPESPPAVFPSGPDEPAETAAADLAGSPPAPDCVTATARARRAMRAGQPGRALHLLDEHEGTAGARGSRRCRDEIGYLRAEALRASGRLREAIAAYLRLDRRGAEPAMRQNALFAAGELEERAGRHQAAYRRFEGALAVAPTGGLREEAMARAMQAAWAAREEKTAQDAAQRYLGAYPRGASAARARQILHETAGGSRR